MNTISVGEKVEFTQSRTKKELLKGVVLSITKMQVAILADNATQYIVHLSRVKPLKTPSPKAASSFQKNIPSLPSEDEVLYLNQLNTQVSNVQFSLHGSKRYEERLSNYSPAQLEQFLLESEPAPWELESGSTLKAFFHPGEKLIFLTDFTGKKIVTTYKKYNAPSTEEVPLVKKVKHRHQLELASLEEDCDDLEDPRLYYQATKSLKRERSKISKGSRR